MATKADLEQRIIELESEIQALLAQPKNTADVGYVTVLELLLDEVELKLPRAFDGFGWRNWI